VDLSRVDPDKVRQAALRVEQAAQDIDGIRIRVQSHAADIGAAWRSGSGNVFQGVMDTWNTDFAALRAALDAMHVKLSHTHVHYRNAEQEQGQAVSGVRALLNGST